MRFCNYFQKKLVLETITTFLSKATEVSIFPASSRKLQFNLLLAHGEDPFSVCSFGVLWNEKCYIIIKHSLNETLPELTLAFMNLLLSPCVHLPTAQSLTQLSDSLTLRKTQSRNCRVISGQKLSV